MTPDLNIEKMKLVPDQITPQIEKRANAIAIQIAINIAIAFKLHLQSICICNQIAFAIAFAFSICGLMWSGTFFSNFSIFKFWSAHQI